MVIIHGYAPMYRNRQHVPYIKITDKFAPNSNLTPNVYLAGGQKMAQLYYCV